MAHYTLIGGTKNWSSWTLRPWLLMKTAQIPFEEIEIALRAETTKADILKHSPSGLIPALRLKDGFTIWDSLAICEFLAERHGEKQLWPSDAKARAFARAAACEMHSGFAAMRRDMPMDVLARLPRPEGSEEVARNIARICAIWRAARAAFEAQGPFLFGRFSIADAMYAPVVSRFVTYDIALDPAEAAYVKTISALPAMQEWRAACAAWEARHAVPPPA